MDSLEKLIYAYIRIMEKTYNLMIPQEMCKYYTKVLQTLILSQIMHMPNLNYIHCVLQMHFRVLLHEN